MTLTKLKTKNQVTLPTHIVKQLGLQLDEFFSVEVSAGGILLTPVTVEPKYTAEDLAAMDRVVEAEKPKTKAYKAGKSFDAYLDALAK